MSRPRTPTLAADVIIALRGRPQAPIVLIERKYPPLGWALPGGFVEVNEPLERAAVREAKEETGLDVRLIALLGLYSDPGRDTRGHTVSAVYMAEADGDPCAADDAAAVRIVTLDALPGALAFDHAQILVDYRRYRATGAVAPLRYV